MFVFKLNSCNLGVFFPLRACFLGYKQGFNGAIVSRYSILFKNNQLRDHLIILAGIFMIENLSCFILVASIFVYFWWKESPPATCQTDTI